MMNDHHTCYGNFIELKGKLMVLLFIIAGYIFVSVVLYGLMKAKCKKDPVFIMPTEKRIFYLLSVTWGFFTVISGAVPAIILRILGIKPAKYGWLWRFEIPGIEWGTSFGLFFIAPKGNDQISMHEHGHAIQNIYLGPFYPAVVWLPSVIRFWYRKLLKKRNGPLRKKYSDIWFEKSSDESGKTFIEKFKKEQS
jgi:hypothetical protein